MPNGPYSQGGRRETGRHQQPSHEQGRRAQSGGRSEHHAHERDREQRHAGYGPHDWERNEESYRTVHSEPDWDPTRLSHDQRGFHYDAMPNTPRDGERRAHYGYDDDYELQQRRIHGAYARVEARGYAREQYNDGFSTDYGHAPLDSRHASPEFERDFRQHEHSLASEIGNAGRRLIGKIKRVVRNPKNYTRSDERVREDVCDRLAVSHEVDPTEIEVTVSAGEVTLVGTVASRQMKFVAEEIADDVPGVHDVHNQLRVARGATPQATSNVAINSQDAGRANKNIGRS
jgi:osmotically-inducible protein OsmY